MFDAACSIVSASFSQGIVKLLKSDHNHCVKQFAFIVRIRSSYLLSRRLKHTFLLRHSCTVIDHFTFGLKVQF